MKCPNCGKRMTSKSDFVSFYHWEDECEYYKKITVYTCKSCKITKSGSDDWIIPDELRATEKQIKLATWISETLGIKLPNASLKNLYSKFIGDNKPKFDEKLAYQRKHYSYDYIDDDYVDMIFDFGDFC